MSLSPISYVFQEGQQAEREINEVEERLKLFRRFMEKGGLLPAGQWTLGDQEADHLFGTKLPKTLTNFELHLDRSDLDNEGSKPSCYQADGRFLHDGRANSGNNLQGTDRIRPAQ